MTLRPPPLSLPQPQDPKKEDPRKEEPVVDGRGGHHRRFLDYCDSVYAVSKYVFHKKQKIGAVMRKVLDFYKGEDGAVVALKKRTGTYEVDAANCFCGGSIAAIRSVRFLAEGRYLCVKWQLEEVKG